MHIHLPYLIFPWSFNEIRLVVSENSRGHEQYPIYSCRTHQRAITLGKIIEPEHAGDMRIHLWYLIFPWSFTEIRQAVSENLRGQERDGRTDARTHGRSGDYMLPRNSSGSIINPCRICCRYSLEVPHCDTSKDYLNMFLWWSKKIYSEDKILSPCWEIRYKRNHITIKQRTKLLQLP